MKHGKKYVEAAKLYDKQTQYDKLTSAPAATDATQISRSAAP